MADLPTVYVETTIPSYLAARPSRDVITLARQQLTQTWWDLERGSYRVFVSRVVLEEIAAGDPDAASERLARVSSLTVLEITPDVAELASWYSAEIPLPTQAAADAIPPGSGRGALHGLPAHMELRAPSQRRGPTPAAAAQYEAWRPHSDHLHAGGTCPMEHVAVEDPVVAEVRKNRERLLARFNYDLAAYCNYLASLQGQPRPSGGNAGQRPQGR